MLLLVVALILFIAVHLIRVLAPGFRLAMIAKVGRAGWIVIQSLLSLATLVLLVYAFGEARQTTGILYNPPMGMAHLTATLMLVAMICLVAGLLPAGYISTKTKHPIVLAIKIWALSHLLSNGETSSVLLFVAFLAWGVILRIALKKRVRAGEIALRPFRSGRFDIIAVVVGIVLWAAFIWKLHYWLIGVYPLAIG